MSLKTQIQPLCLTATERAKKLLRTLKTKHDEELIFYQSAGCCDGSVTLCVPARELPMGGMDECIGNIEGTGFWMSTETIKRWNLSRLVLDVGKGQAGAFSLENGTGERFVLLTA